METPAGAGTGPTYEWPPQCRVWKPDLLRGVRLMTWGVGAMVAGILPPGLSDQGQGCARPVETAGVYNDYKEE
jgi:hypothetical protein